MMLMKKHSNAVRADERGFASLVIAIVLVVVLSLITVGFAQLMRSEERSALDKQLSSQAYYAAESGINAATKAINNGFTESKTDCAPNPGVADLADNTVKFTNGQNPTNASYPCLLINPSPTNLHYDPISTTISRTAQFTAIDSTGQPSPVTSIKISWEDSGNNQTFTPNCNNFRPTADWSYIGMLRFQLVPIAAGSLDRTSLTNNAFTGFLCPNGGTLNNTAHYGTSIGPTNAGVIINGNCNTSASPEDCNVTINGLPGDRSTFFINMKSLYSATSVTITAYNGTTPLRLKGAQTLIDSTGKAQDVLRRIQVRVATKNGFDIPSGTHADICKVLNLEPTATTSTASADTGCDTQSLTY